MLLHPDFFISIMADVIAMVAQCYCSLSCNIWLDDVIAIVADVIAT